MHDRVSVDVVIPCFNGINFIDGCLESLLTQTAKICCIIFIDDGSTDESYSRILQLSTQDSRIKVVKQANQGLSSARNAGISASDSTHIAFLDIDDRWLPFKLERQLEFANSDADLLIASNYLNDVGDHFVNGIYNCNHIKLNSSNLLMFRCVVPGSASSVLIPRKLIDKAGRFSENLRYGEDWDYWIRISRFAKWKVVNNQDVIIYQNPVGMQAIRRKSIDPYLDSSLQIINLNRRYLGKLEFLFLLGYISFVGAKTTEANFKSYLELLQVKFSLNGSSGHKPRNSKVGLIPLLILGFGYSSYIKLVRICGNLNRLRSRN
jgi:glycosyltransferase involved in cell wall biosynthesis